MTSKKVQSPIRFTIWFIIMIDAFSPKTEFGRKHPFRSLNNSFDKAL